MHGLNASVTIDLDQNYGHKLIPKNEIRRDLGYSKRRIHTRFIAGESAK
jgi:hypothetical protein